MVLWELLTEEVAPVLTHCQYLELILGVSAATGAVPAVSSRAPWIFIATLETGHQELFFVGEETRAQIELCPQGYP